MTSTLSNTMKPLYIKNFLLILLVVLSFGGSVNNGYSFDDEYVTTPKNSLVSKGISGIGEILSSHYSTIDNVKFGYRPVTKVSFALEHQLFGFNPTASHIINVLLYMMVVLLVFKILRLLFSSTSEWTLFFICAIFAVHPLHSEVVLSLKNREELLVALFGFLTFYFTILYFEKKRIVYILYGILLIIIGAVTKLTFLPYILFIPISLWYLKRIHWKQASILFASFSFIVLTIRTIPPYFLRTSLSRNAEFFENPLFFMSLLERLPNGFSSFFLYAKLHILPDPLLSYYGHPYIEIFNWTNYKVYLGIILGVLILYAIYKKRNTLIGFGLITYLIFIVPYTNFPIPAMGIIAERFTFSSVLGFAIILVCIIEYIKKSKRKMSYLTFGILLLMTGLSIFVNRKRTKDWKGVFSLIEVDVKKAPKSPKLQMLYGEMLQTASSNTKNRQASIQYANAAGNAYKKAIQLAPKYSKTYNNLGILYYLSGNYEEAILLIRKSIELGDSIAVNYYNLGACYEAIEKKVQAKKFYKKSLEKNPKYFPSRNKLKALNITVE